jgi:hypothetical protein
MERRKALAFAAAVTGTLGTASVAVAAVGGLSVLGFGAVHHDTRLSSLASYQSGPDGVVIRTKDVYDRVTVEGGGSAAATRSVALASGAAPALSDPAIAPGPEAAVGPSRGVKTHRRRATKTVPRSAPRTPATTSTTEPARSSETPKPGAPAPPAVTTTTMAPVTTTTRPRGVPADWPPGKPIPPMPPNCGQPKLEDNGVWNCQD